MSWAKLDDRFHGNRKVRRAWRRCRPAIGLYVLCLTYAAQHETDGHVDVEFVEDTLPEPVERDQAVNTLVDVGLWEPGPDGGWLIHDYLDYNRSRERAAEERRLKAGRQRRWRDKTSGQYVDASVDASRDAAVDPAPSRPDPTPEPTTDDDRAHDRNRERGEADTPALQQLEQLAARHGRPFDVTAARAALDGLPPDQHEPLARHLSEVYAERRVRDVIGVLRATIDGWSESRRQPSLGRVPAGKRESDRIEAGGTAYREDAAWVAERVPECVNAGSEFPASVDFRAVQLYQLVKRESPERLRVFRQLVALNVPEFADAIREAA